MKTLIKANQIEAITEQDFNSWDSAKQDQWLKDHPNSKFGDPNKRPQKTKQLVRPKQNPSNQDAPDSQSSKYSDKISQIRDLTTEDWYQGQSQADMFVSDLDFAQEDIGTIKSLMDNLGYQRGRIFNKAMATQPIEKKKQLADWVINNADRFFKPFEDDRDWTERGQDRWDPDQASKLLIDTLDSDKDYDLLDDQQAKKMDSFIKENLPVSKQYVAFKYPKILQQRDDEEILQSWENLPAKDRKWLSQTFPHVKPLIKNLTKGKPSAPKPSTPTNNPTKPATPKPVTPAKPANSPADQAKKIKKTKDLFNDLGIDTEADSFDDVSEDLFYQIADIYDPAGGTIMSEDWNNLINKGELSGGISQLPKASQNELLKIADAARTAKKNWSAIKSN